MLTASTVVVSAAILGGAGTCFATVIALAVIDYTKNALATPDAIKRCPTGAIVWVEGVQRLGPERRTPALEGAGR